MTLRPAPGLLRLPRNGGPSFDDAMQQIERADAQNAKQNMTPTFPAVILTAPDGSSWRLTVDASGALQTAVVPR